MGGALPQLRFDEVAARDKGECIANQRFGLSLLESLLDNDALPMQISAAPATDCPHNRTLLFTRRYDDDGVAYLEVPFLNTTGIKHLTRLASAVVLAIPEMRRRGTEVIVVNGILSPFLATALLARRRLAVPAAVVITNPPNVANAFDNPLSLALKRLDDRLIRRMLPRFDAVIAVTSQIVEVFTPDCPDLILEGFAPDLAVGTQSRTNRRPHAVYAGGVKAAYGVDLLIQAQALADFDLAVFGAGPFVAAGQSQPGVRYGGVVDLVALKQAYAEADVLVSAQAS